VKTREKVDDDGKKKSVVNEEEVVDHTVVSLTG
jgi:hypothetical protein